VSEPALPPNGVDQITDELVAQLGIIAGLHFPAERLPAISQRLRDMHTVAADLDSVELGNVEPAIRFDPSWPEAGAK
jgi:Asp-tRNA(Asn)/Glu-tRNA(Gln) amidotransferase C subunit